MKVAVVGAGVMGCATAWAFRERGADVTLFEQFEPGHVRGSSHGQTRIFRLAYPEQRWVELADEALIGWRQLEQQVGTGLLGLTGFVEICSSVDVSSHNALEARLISHRLVDPSDLGFTAPVGWVALVQPEGGVVFADEAVVALRGDTPVVRRKVESLDEVDADVVVVTAGSWVTDLVPDLPVTVTRETVAYFACDGERPSVVELDDATRNHAMFSLHDPQYGLKAGVHHGGHVADPNVDEPPDDRVVEQIAAWVAERFPDVDPTPVAAETCLYTTTADENFILERRGRVVIGSACSGHGFKFAPAVGRKLAALALERDDPES
jgi:sarcosine oxidase